MRLFLFYALVAYALANYADLLSDPRNVCSEIVNRKPSNESNFVSVEEELSNLLCTKTGKRRSCRHADECAEEIIESDGNKTGCVIPAIVTSTFEVGIPSIATFGSDLARFLEILVVLRSKLQKVMVSNDGNIDKNFHDFLETNLPKFAEALIQESSFDAALNVIPKLELNDCNVNGTVFVECYAQIHARILFEQELTKILADAPAFERLARILFNGNLREVEKLTIVVRSLREGIEEHSNNNRQIQDSFLKIKLLRKLKNSECQVRRNIRKIYLLLNRVDIDYVESQASADHLQCQGNLEPTGNSTELARECTLAHGLLINNNNLTVQEKLAALNDSRWSCQDTVHYTAFTYIVYNYDLYEDYGMADDWFDVQVEYKNALWEKLKTSCEYELVLANASAGLSILDDDFPEFNFTHSSYMINQLEQFIRDRIFLDSDEAWHLHKIFEIAGRSGSIPSKRGKIAYYIEMFDPFTFRYNHYPYTERLILANTYKNEIEEQFGEELARGFVKQTELLFAGIYRRKQLLPLDNVRFQHVVKFVTELNKRRISTAEVIPRLRESLKKVGITDDILAEVNKMIGRFNSEQLGKVLNALKAAKTICNEGALGGSDNETDYGYTTPDTTVNFTDLSVDYNNDSTVGVSNDPYSRYPTRFTEEGSTRPSYTYHTSTEVDVETSERSTPPYSRNPYRTSQTSRNPSTTAYSRNPYRTSQTSRNPSTTAYSRNPYRTSQTSRNPSTTQSSPNPYRTSHTSTPLRTIDYGTTTEPNFNNSTYDEMTTGYSTPASNKQCTCQNKPSVIETSDFCGWPSKVTVTVDFGGNGRTRRNGNSIEAATLALAHEIFGIEDGDHSV